MLLFSDFSEKMVVFQLDLIVRIRIMSCGSENRETVAGLLVKVQIREPDRVLGGAVVGKPTKPSGLSRVGFPALRNLQVAIKRWLVCVNALPGNEAKIFNQL